jgi:hypothetical protein
MVDPVDRAQELEELQRQDALRRVLDRARPAAPIRPNPTPSPDEAETDVK